MSQNKPVLGTASGSPDLVGRLEAIAEMRHARLAEMLKTCADAAMSQQEENDG